MNAGVVARLRAHRPRLVAADPGRVRLTNASIVALAVLLSAFCAWLMVTFAHADHALMAVGTFLALQTGLVAKGANSRERLLTTTLLIVPIVAGLTLATALSSWRPVEIVGFVAVGGLATWARRFGPRYTAMGAVAFFGYFFALFLRPTFAQLPQFFAAAACAVGSVLLLRLITVADRPHRQITLLLTQLRGACAAALKTATTAGPPALPALRQDLRRIDQVGLAITGWQSRFATARHVDCDAATLAILTLNARIDTQHACVEIVQSREADASRATELLTAPIADLRVALHTGTSDAALEAAADRATARLHANNRGTADVLAAAITDRATISHAALHRLRLHPQRARAPEATATVPSTPAIGVPTAAAHPESSPPDNALSPVRPAVPRPARWWQRWQNWTVTSRMAVQVMAAAGLATITGDAISASRWYWAVLTAFLVFAGTTTRGAILTRATRRILGTLAGVVIGFALTILLDGQAAGLILMCVVGVFCTLYLGPLQYTVQAFFITIVLTAMYGLLGVLNRQILEVRLAETAAGAVIGVVCAYLIFSTNSHRELVAKFNGYFDAADRLLEKSRTSLTATYLRKPVLGATAHLDTAQAELADLLSSISLSLIGGRHALYTELEHRLRTANYYGDRLATISAEVSQMTPEEASAEHGVPADWDPAVNAAIDQVLTTSAHTRAVLCSRGDHGPAPPGDGDSPVHALLSATSADPGSFRFGAAMALSGMNWALEQAAAVSARGPTAYLPWKQSAPQPRNVRPSTGSTATSPASTAATPPPGRTRS